MLGNLYWIAEFWNDAAGRWQMADAQLDATWREKLGFTGDPLALTPAQFAKLIEDDSRHWETLIKSVGAKIE